MATFRAGKLARKTNGRFQSTAVTSRTENFLDSRKRECESETVLSGRRVVSRARFELADGCNYCSVSTFVNISNESHMFRT